MKNPVFYTIKNSADYPSMQKQPPVTLENLEPKQTKKLDQGVTEHGVKTTEIGGFNGLEPTRYGDWEKNGRCYDF